MSWWLEGCTVLGGLVSSDDDAAFESGPVVLARAEEADDVLEVHRFVHENGVDLADGDAFPLDDWHQQVKDGEAIAFKDPPPAVPGTEVWILRKKFQGRAAALKTLRQARLIRTEQKVGTCIAVLIDQ